MLQRSGWSAPDAGALHFLNDSGGRIGPAVRYHAGRSWDHDRRTAGGGKAEARHGPVASGVLLIIEVC
jgi:hypothetical protein